MPKIIKSTQKVFLNTIKYQKRTIKYQKVSKSTPIGDNYKKYICTKRHKISITIGFIGFLFSGEVMHTSHTTELSYRVDLQSWSTWVIYRGGDGLKSIPPVAGGHWKFNIQYSIVYVKIGSNKVNMLLRGKSKYSDQAFLLWFPFYSSCPLVTCPPVTV